MDNVYTSMATIQAKTSGRYKYWYIVESRRVNGKPRPVVLAYLGKAEDLLRRLQQAPPWRIKSYSHGAVAALLLLVERLGIVAIINQHVPATKTGAKQIRHGLTVGASLVLRAIERVCGPCSNRAFADWATTTSLQYLLRIACAKLDSQHFWDQMNELPAEAIAKIEQAIVSRLLATEKISLDTLLWDATNFFTFIDTTNDRCPLAQRGKNQQGRGNLRQVGVLLLVSRQDILPLFHETYPGNKPDSKVFAQAIGEIIGRLKGLVSDLQDVTVVFGRGNNSKTNLSAEVLGLHYVGALVPSQHRDLIEEARPLVGPPPAESAANSQTGVYRVQRELWGRQRTLLVHRSAELYQGQLRGIGSDLKKRTAQLDELNQRRSSPGGKLRQRKQLVSKVGAILKGQFMDGLIEGQIRRVSGRYTVEYHVNSDALEELKGRLGLRILMTDRHDWSSQEIIAAYHGQAKVEYGFRNLKNPYHIGLRPQFCWTEQKIKVHVFTCVLGLLLGSVLHRQARLAGYPSTNYDNLLDRLNGVRLATLLAKGGKRGRVKAVYQLEETEPLDDLLIDALGIRDLHRSRPKISGIGVYC